MWLRRQWRRAHRAARACRLVGARLLLHDDALAAAIEARKACGGAAATDGGTAGAPSDHERLLLRRAASFVILGQYAEAVADYRAAAR